MSLSLWIFLTINMQHLQQQHWWCWKSSSHGSCSTERCWGGVVKSKNYSYAQTNVIKSSPTIIVTIINYSENRIFVEVVPHYIIIIITYFILTWSWSFIVLISSIKLKLAEMQHFMRPTASTVSVIIISSQTLLYAYYNNIINTSTEQGLAR